MIDIAVLMIMFGCSESTARRKIKRFYDMAKVPEELRSKNSIPASILEKYGHITWKDIEISLSIIKREESRI